MCAKLCTFILFFLLHYSVIGQEITALEIVGGASTIRGTTGTTLSARVHMRNNTDKTISIKVEKIISEEIVDSRVYFSLGSLLTSPQTHISENAVVLVPGATLEDFTVFYATSFIEEKKTVYFRFFNEKSPHEFVVIPITFVVHNDKQDPSMLFRDNVVEVSNLYPNPATSVINFDYHIKQPSAHTMIVIRNILGSKIGEYTIRAKQRVLSISIEKFKAGLYFYTLSVGGKNVVTKKFMIH